MTATLPHRSPLVSGSNPAAKLVKGDLAEEVRKMKKDPGDNIAILGSGSIVSQLAKEV